MRLSPVIHCLQHLAQPEKITNNYFGNLTTTLSRQPVIPKPQQPELLSALLQRYKNHTDFCQAFKKNIKYAQAEQLKTLSNLLTAKQGIKPYTKLLQDMSLIVQQESAAREPKLEYSDQITFIL